MKIKNLNNGAIEIDADVTKLSDRELKHLIYLISENITVVLKRQNLTPEQLIKTATKYGIVNHVPMWCAHPKYPEILRVTNHVVNDKGQMGLFNTGELDWHCNGITAKEPEEVVIFYGKEMYEYSNKTIYSNGQKVWDLLSSDEQNDFIGSLVYRTNQKGEGGRILDKSVGYNWTKDETKDLDKVSNRNKFNLPYSQAERKRFFENRLAFPHKISGKWGIFFPFIMSSGIKIPGYSDQQNIDMFYKLIDLFNKEEVIYEHTWEEGDIVFNDQTQALHKREGDDIRGSREIWRIVFWYNFEQYKVDPKINYVESSTNTDGFIYEQESTPSWIPA